MAEIQTCRWDLNDDEKDSGDEKMIIKKKAKTETDEKLQIKASDAMDCVAVTESNVGVSVLKDSSPMKENIQNNSPKRVDETVVAVESLAAAEVAVTNRKKTAKAIAEADHNPLHHGCRSVDEYIRLNFIDQGTYGVVFRAKCKKSGRIYALKQVKIGKEAAKVGFPVTALRETNILLALRHPNIVRVREMVVGKDIDKVYMVMDFGGLDLKACMDKAKKPFSTAEVKQLMIQFLGAVHHMHEKWYIHRDLKTTNLLYQDGVLRVCDFGLARKYGSPIAPYTFEVVTLWYRPTELLLGKREYSTPLDLWAVGCIFAEMLTGRPLFPGEGEVDQINKIFKMLGAPTEDQWPGVTSLPHASKISWKQPTRGKLRELLPTASFSGGAYLNDTGYDLLTKLLTMDPNQRISAADALCHPWLTVEAPLPTSMDMMPRVKPNSQDVEEDAEEVEREKQRKTQELSSLF